MTRIIRYGALALWLLPVCVFSSNAHSASPDADLYTTYFFSDDYSTLYLTVCGSVSGSEGRFGGGKFGPFGYIGAILGSPGSVSGDEVDHSLYIVDVAGGAGNTAVVLYRYEVTNSITPPNDIVSYKLTGRLSLPLTGGMTARCMMAANAKYLFVGTDQGTTVMEISKKDLGLTPITGSISPVSTINADDRGYVSVTFGTLFAGSFAVFGPDGNSLGGGGAAQFTLPSFQGLSTKDLPTGQ